MKDVRNSHRKGIRTACAIKGFRAEVTQQDKFITWHRWGYDRQADTDEKDFMDAFHIEWDKVEKHNLEKYGRLDPWQPVKGSYRMREKPNE